MTIFGIVILQYVISVVFHLSGRRHYVHTVERLIRPDARIAFAYDVSNLESGQLAKWQKR